MKTLTEFQLGYLVSTIDCEGTISLGRTVSSAGNLWYSANVRVGNTNMNLLIYLREVTGIGIISPPRNRHERRKLSFDWSLRVEEINEFLPIIGLHLVTKQEQARLLMEFMKTVTTDHEFRNIIYHQMRELNQKGI